MASQTQLKAPQSGSQSQNLWQKALESLDDDLKASLNFKKSTQPNIVAAVLRTAQEKKQLCLQKRWKFKKTNGEEIILRDVVEKIIVWLDKFKAVGDAAIQYDPAHAALAWAGVRFLLQVSCMLVLLAAPAKTDHYQVAVGDKHVFGATIEGLETISHLITRYAIFEDLYMQRDSAARGELETMLTGLYAEALIFLAKARKYFQTSTASEWLMCFGSLVKLNTPSSCGEECVPGCRG